MQYYFYTPQEEQKYSICLLIDSIRPEAIRESYIEPFDLNADDILIMDYHQARGKKKTPNQEIKEYISTELMPVFESMKTEIILVTDADYFKVLTKSAKVEPHIGYVLDSVFGPQKVIYLPNYRRVFYDPQKINTQIAQSILALKNYLNGIYQPPGQNIIQYEAYPMEDVSIKARLQVLLEMDCDLTCDIEAFSLKHYKAGIGTISFAWNKSSGIAFPVDYQPMETPGAPYGWYWPNIPSRKMLREFFEAFAKTGRKLIFHSIGYDVTVLIYTLWMNNLLDTKGLLKGLDILLGKDAKGEYRWHCSKLITYLATNSCAGNDLSLKTQTQEYAGNYAQTEINDITRIPINSLLRYNLIDALSTWYVKEKHWDTLVKDQQEDIYRNLFQPAMVDIIQMQLTGMPINHRRVREVRWALYKDKREALKGLKNSRIIRNYRQKLQQAHVDKRNSELKTKRISLSDDKVSKIFFNPNSNPQLQDLLYYELELPILDYTDNGQPATGGKTLEKLRNHTKDQEILDLLQNLIDYAAVEKILSSFIPAMLEAKEANDGWHYLFGNFNLGGTLSGRLSSSDPNLQNLPANSKYAKLIKSCFQAPPGWIFVGLDFDSLEDKISALTTKDPNKIKVYTDGYDGHALRAVTYWREYMPDIDVNSVVSVNSIADKHHQHYHYRQKSKAPTFALTYQGTYHTLMNNCGFPQMEAMKIEQSYKELYSVSIKWVEEKLSEASRVGYITGAFGLRLRTPLLAQVVRGTSKTPAAAEAEGRTAGNALGQSWCLLNTRASVEFMGKVRNSAYRYDIKPCAQIHDAQYYLISDDLFALTYLNNHLVEAVRWQEHPDIQHNQVKLGGKVTVFWPTWNDEISIPNDADAHQILDIIESKIEG